MYGKEPTNKKREPVVIEEAADCPTCGAPRGHACVLFRDDWRDPKHENAGDPHDKRRIAADGVQ